MTIHLKKEFILLFFGLALLSGCQNDPVARNDSAAPEPTGWFNSSNVSKGVFFAAATDPSNPNIIYAGSSTIGVYRTDNGGLLWKNANRGLPAQPTRSFFVDPNNPKTVYAGTAGGGVFVTFDSGEIWEPINSGLTHAEVYAVVYNPHAAPTGLQVTSSDTANLLSWNAVPNATEYLISVCSSGCDTTPPAAWALIPRSSADILKQNHTHPGLTSGTAYYYTVRAKVAGVISPFSSAVSAVPKAASGARNPPDVPYPNGISATAGNNYNIIRWNGLSGVSTTYTLYKSGTPGVLISGPTTLQSALSSTAYTDTAVSNGTTAYYAVTAKQEVVVTEDDETTPNINERVTVIKESLLSAEVSAVPRPMTALFVATGGGGIFASGPAGEFRSTVNGTTPNDFPTIDALDISTLLIDPATLTSDLPTLYAGTREGVYRTVDGGKNWSAYKGTDTGTNLPAVLSLVLAGQKLYAGTASGIYQGFSDGIVPWTSLGHTTLAVTSLLIDPGSVQTLYATSATGGILKSSDAGATWNSSNQGLTVLDIRSILVHPTDRNLLYAGGVGTLFKSANGGGQWNPMDLGTLDNVSNSLPTATVQTLVATPGVGGLLYAGGSAGVFKSADQGKGWAPMNTQLGGGKVVALEVNPLQPGHLYAALSGEGIYKSMDGGGSWRPENGFSTAVPPTTIPQNVTGLIIDPRDPSRFYAGTSGLGVYLGTEGADGHLSWSPANVGLESSSILSLAAVPEGGTTTVYAGTFQDGIFKQVDSSVSSWQKIGGELSGKSILTLAIHPQSASTLFAGISSGLYRSQDGGLTWLPVTGLQGIEVLSVSFDSSTNPAVPILYAGTSSGVYKSVDDGEKWTYMDDGMASTVYSILADPQQPNIVYSGTLATGLFKRTK